MPDSLFAQVKRLVAEKGTTFTNFVTDAIREKLARRARRGASPATKLTTYGTGGPGFGVDLDDSSTLLDLMDGVVQVKHPDDLDRR